MEKLKLYMVNGSYNTMWRGFIHKHFSMILISILFFYLGCGITLSFIHIDCASAVTSPKSIMTANMNQVEYVVLIISSPENEIRRDAIRSTWANFVHNIFVENGEKIYKWNHTWVGPNVPQNFIKVMFAVGTLGLDSNKQKKMDLEHARTRDLLILDNLHDSYSNLATKLVQSIKWISENLKQMKYVVKCDDDSFVRIDLIIRELDAFAPDMSVPEIKKYVTFKKVLSQYKGLYWGYFDGRAKVNLNGKWEEKDWFLCDTYLPYALGGGYIISRSIVDYVSRNSDFLSLYHSEDVSMGVWTAALDGINRVHDTRFDTQWKSRGCEEDMLVRHKQTTKEMFEMYKTLVYSHGKKLCKTESNLRKSYYYNWNVLPSMCCK